MRTKTKILLGLFALFACAAFAAGRRTAPETSPAVAPLPAEDEELNRRPLRLPLREPRVVVRKGARRLELFAGGERVRVFRVALGFAAEGDKERQGDGR